MNIIPFNEFIRRYYSGEEFVIFDTETTGLNTFHDDIIEIGAKKWSREGKLETFCELMWVNPNKISQGAWEVHQIPLADIEKAKKPEQVLADFLTFAGDRTLVAHNIKFDYPILNSNLIRNGLKPYQNEHVACSLVYAKENHLPGKLSDLAGQLNVQTKKESLHRALYDVDILADVLDTFMKKHEPEELQYSLIL